MSYWPDRLKAHPIWASLEALGRVLDEALDREGNGPAEVESLVRLKAVLAAAGKRVAGLDAQALSFPPLDAASNNINEVAGQVRQFHQSGNAAFLNAAQAQADAAIQNLAIVAAGTSEGLVWAKEAAEAYQRGLSALLADARSTAAKTGEEFAALKVRVAELTQEIATEKQRLSNVTSEYQAQFSAAQESRRQEGTALHSSHEQALSSLARDYERQLGERTKQFEEAIAQAAKDQKAALAELRQDFVASAKEMEAEINRHREQVEKLVGVIGDLGVTSGYKTTADSSARTALAWQRGTVAALVVFAGVAAFTLFQIVKGEFSWMGLAGRLFVSIAFGVLAGYCGAQAEKYQRLETRNRRLALELAALGPFLAPLPKEKQDDFRLAMGARTFGAEEPRAPDSKSPTNALEVLTSKEVGELATLLLKRALK